MIFSWDNRLTPEINGPLWTDRKSEREWHYCKYCYRDVPTFQLAEGNVGSVEPVSVMRCCWECGAGLEPLEPGDSLQHQENVLLDLEDQFEGGEA